MDKYGGGDAYVRPAPFKEPIILEDKRLKIEFLWAYINGSLRGGFLNKTDSDIYLVSFDTTVNGKNYIHNYLDNGKNILKAHKKLYYTLPVYDYYTRSGGIAHYLKPGYEDGPKVVKNKITFKRGDTIIKYKHNNKVYTLKLPARTETHDVYYTNDSVYTQHEQIRKEQLGY